MVHPDLKPLLVVQELDDVVRAAKEALGAVDPEVRTFDEALQAAEQALDAARAEVEANGQRREELETKIENYRQLQERKQERLQYVHGPKEASALMAEIDLTRNVMAQEEAEWLRSSGSVTDAERKVKNAEEALDAVKAEQASPRAELEERLQALRRKVRETERDRDEAAQHVNAAILERYVKIAKNRGRGLYALHGFACGCCFTNIPIHRRAQVERGSVIEVCEACGVLLYVPDNT